MVDNHEPRDAAGLKGQLPEGWTWARLGSLADFVNGDRGANYPTQSDRVNAGLPFINTGHIEPNGRLSHDRMDYISKVSFDKLRAGKVKPGDIVYCLRGSTIGKTARNDFAEGAIASSLVIVRSKPNVSQDYLYFYLISPFGQQLVKERDNGSAQPNLSVRTLSEYPVPVPPLAEQTAIGRILSALDDKIELNRRMNETLEAMAQALFKSWFVDFDPVRAKAEGRDLAVAKEVARLFPSDLAAVEEGDIPAGWHFVTLSGICEINPQRMLRKNQVAPYVDMASIPIRGHSLDGWSKRPYGSGTRFHNGDTLLARITPCLENGKTAYVDVLEDGEIGWGSTEYIVLRPKPPIPSEYAYCLARSETFRTAAIQSMTGSSGRQRVPFEAVANFNVAAPSQAVAEAFGEVVSPLFSRMKAAASESRALAEMRDALLPRLISGEIRLVGS
ncbi:MAG: type restriction enzyme subunit [Bradyrhizobium sp.]|jgi:type I restriction enzyme S subunit|nr:type restriction enzyme subunit [Bradyrhizobium sp.]MEA2952427.1 type restriction enzyme subunit [Alphaproteobacteria bacterium]